MIRTILYFLLVIPCGAFALADAARSHHFAASLWALIFFAQVVTLVLMARARTRRFTSATRFGAEYPDTFADTNHFSGNAHQRRIARRAELRKAQGA